MRRHLPRSGPPWGGGRGQTPEWPLHHQRPGGTLYLQAVTRAEKVPNMLGGQKVLHPCPSHGEPLPSQIGEWIEAKRESLPTCPTEWSQSGSPIFLPLKTPTLPASPPTMRALVPVWLSTLPWWILRSCSLFDNAGTCTQIRLGHIHWCHVHRAACSIRDHQHEFQQESVQDDTTRICISGYCHYLHWEGGTQWTSHRWAINSGSYHWRCNWAGIRSWLEPAIGQRSHSCPLHWWNIPISPCWADN